MNIENYQIVPIDYSGLSNRQRISDKTNINTENYQINIIDKLKITRIRDNSLVNDALTVLITQGNNYFDAVSTLTDIKTNYKIINNNIIATVPIETNCDLCRFNKIQLMADNVIIDNTYIKKIYLYYFFTILDICKFDCFKKNRISYNNSNNILIQRQYPTNKELDICKFDCFKKNRISYNNSNNILIQRQYPINKELYIGFIEYIKITLLVL